MLEPRLHVRRVDTRGRVEDQINATSKAWIDAIEASTAQHTELHRYRASHPNLDSLAVADEPAAEPPATGRKPRTTD